MENQITTRLEVNRAKISWKIEEFDYELLEGREPIRSPSFSMDHNEEITWHIIFGIEWNEYNDLDLIFYNPYDDPEESDRPDCVMVNLSLVPENSKYLPFEAKVTLAIATSYGSIYERSIKMMNSRDTLEDKFHVKKTDFERSTNELTITCDICTITRPVYVPISLKSPQKTLESLSKDFQQLWETGKFSDFTLIVNGKKFTVHRMILASRSPYFAALENEWKETTERQMVIEDANEDAVEEVLRFIYTGKAENLETLAHEILKLSELYLLQELTNICVDAICKEMTEDNAVDLLISAELHSNKTLKDRVENFIAQSIQSFVENEKFQSLKDSKYCRLYYDVYDIVISKKK